MGSPAVAGWIAQAAFWGLLPWSVAAGELSRRAGAVLLALWLAGWLGLPHVPYGSGLFSPYVAVLDIVLVFLVFKGDIRLT